MKVRHFGSLAVLSALLVGGFVTAARAAGSVNMSGLAGTHATVGGATVTHWYCIGQITAPGPTVTVSDINFVVRDGAGGTWREYNGVNISDTSYQVYGGGGTYGSSVNLDDDHHHPGPTAPVDVKLHVYFSDGSDVYSSVTNTGCP